MTATAPVHPLAGLAFDNSYARLGDAFGTRVAPTPLRDPVLLHVNGEVAALLGLDPAEARRPEFLAWAAGSVAAPGSDPVAMLYAGHQFGAWVPQLGDGRAILLGEVVHAGRRWDLHLKGSGPTPYSRGFDGRSVLRSAVREYLVGEALHHLGVPTTRALCLVGSPEPVQREVTETAASIVRVAPSHVRFGSFEVFASRGQREHLATLADHVIAHHFPGLAGRADRWRELLREAAERTARLVARWQAVGFVHGVLNTDNMSVLGITLDFGPYAFMEAFDPGFTPNHSDPGGRYAWDQQPGIGQWNVSALAQALLPLIPREEALAGLDAYVPAWQEASAARMREKLGLLEPRDADGELLDGLLRLLERHRADWTLAWRALGGVTVAGMEDRRGFARLVGGGDDAAAWLADYRTRLRAEQSDDGARRARMDAVNPRFVLRTHLAQRAIEGAQRGDPSELDRLLAVLRRPFDEQPDRAEYARPAADGGAPIVLSCSS